MAIPISLILAFFGINASQVDADRSMFDPAYTGVYAGVGLLTVIAVGLALTLYLHQVRQHRTEPAEGTGLICTPCPGQSFLDPGRLLNKLRRIHRPD